MTKKIMPLGDRVIAKRIEQEEMTAGGIIRPDSAKEKPAQGEIIAISKGVVQDDGSTRPVGVTVGQRVYFGKYAGTEIEVEGEELLILREEDILAVCE